MSDEAFDVVFGQLSQPPKSSYGFYQSAAEISNIATLSDHEAMKALSLPLRYGDELGNSICGADLGAQSPTFVRISQDRSKVFLST